MSVSGTAFFWTRATRVCGLGLRCRLLDLGCVLESFGLEVRYSERGFGQRCPGVKGMRVSGTWSSGLWMVLDFEA